MLKVENINKSFGALTVLSDVSFNIGRGQKIALVGNNGTGKTTLLKLVAGLLKPDAGSVELAKGTCIGYLQQDMGLIESGTVAAYLKSATGIAALERELEMLSSSHGDPSIAERYSAAEEAYRHVDGYSFNHRSKIMLEGFGLDTSVWEKDLRELSSGQKSKVILASILLKGVDLLLLDEPTNNLDLPALIWLEDFLRRSSAACILISHDRRFLDRVARKVFEIDWKTRALKISGGTYSDYLETERKRIIRIRETYRLQQEEIDRLTERARHMKVEAAKGSAWKGSDNDKFLRGFKRDRAAGSARTAKNIEKRIEMMDKLERPVEREPFSIDLLPEDSPRPKDIIADALVCGYPDGFQIGPVSFSVGYGSRMVILGLNGSGKSTLLKTITGVLSPIKGKISIGSGLRIGSMMQEHETLPRDAPVLGFLRERANLDESAAYHTLVRFGFDERQAKTRIAELSPGGRARLILAYFSALSVNALVLDEPTNHLDIEAVEALEETLSTYSGTVILVSHDRYFLEKSKASLIYVVSEEGFKKIPDYGTYIAAAERHAKRLLKQI